MTFEELVQIRRLLGKTISATPASERKVFIDALAEVNNRIYRDFKTEADDHRRELARKISQR